MDWGDYDKEEKHREEWAALRYVPDACPRCGRARVELCQNGKHRCEKCFWCIEEQQPVSLGLMFD